MDGQDYPKYKGVRKRKWGKWVSEIRLPNSRERIWLGSFDSPEKAARAFDAALYCLRGPGAAFNFPDDPPVIPGGRSLSPPEIQAVAHRFGNEVPLPQQPQNVNYTRGEMDSSRGDNDDDVDGDGTGGGSSGLPRAEVDNVNGVNNASGTTMDWSFLSTLDTGDMGPAGSGYFHDDVANGLFEQQYYPPLSSFCDDGGDNNNNNNNYYFGDEDFSNHSFLWNF